MKWNKSSLIALVLAVGLLIAGLSEGERQTAPAPVVGTFMPNEDKVPSTKTPIPTNTPRATATPITSPPGPLSTLERERPPTPTIEVWMP